MPLNIAKPKFYVYSHFCIGNTYVKDWAESKFWLVATYSVAISTPKVNMHYIVRITSYMHDIAMQHRHTLNILHSSYTCH